MKVSAEHGKIERGLKRSWRKCLQAFPKTKEKSLQKRPEQKAIFGLLSYPALCRLVGWCFAFAPSPACWTLALLLATFGACTRAAHWSSRGAEETILDLYGGSDRDILKLSIRWLRATAFWAGLDSTVFLTIFWLTGHVPLWILFIGVPAYVLANTSSTILLSYLLPKPILTLFSGLGYLSIVVFVTFLNKTLSNETILAAFGIIGVLTPCGWAILLVHDLQNINSTTLWIALPMLLGSATAAWFIIPWQQRRLLERSGAEEPPVDSVTREITEEAATAENRQPTDRKLVSQELALIRREQVIGYPGVFAKRDQSTAFLSTAGVILFLAILVHFGAIFPKELRCLVLGGALGLMHAFWFPVFGVPAWLNFSYLSQSRVACVFVLFPVSFRKLMGSLIKSDLRKAGLAAPFLMALSVIALFIAIPTQPWAGLVTGTSLTLFIFLNLPLIWFHHAMLPLSTKPFGIGNIIRGSLTIVMALIFLLEVICACTFPYLMYTQWETDTCLFSIFIFVPALINAVLALFGVYLAINAYEKRRLDVIKPPPKS